MKKSLFICFLFVLYLMVVSCSDSSGNSSSGSVGVPELNAGTLVDDRDEGGWNVKEYTGVTQADVDVYIQSLGHAGFIFDPVRDQYIKTENGKAYLLFFPQNFDNPDLFAIRQIDGVDGNSNNKVDFAPEFRAGTAGKAIEYDTFSGNNRTKSYSGVTQADIDAYDQSLQQAGFTAVIPSEVYEKTIDGKTHVVMVLYEFYCSGGLEIHQQIGYEPW